MLLTTNEPTFTESVLNASSPVLVHFWAPWCKLCLAIEPTLLKFQQDCSEPIQLVNVNADENLKLVNSYRLKMLPTLLIFAEGELLYRIEGFSGREDLRKTLESLSFKTLAKTA
ncbi:thioredoxin family protein [Spirulina sp. CS-785/01]|uniref:thioredoxin family protein n=1 Tax=Spirulina sp. CS-785/01 TaxID=3021716 RepID=UPI00233036A8|nr:thioredoxin family protein [Spirulina sp. CS-785/01]MDB9311871.1 thioredoxin family protein [Spirulina sp. CS-785/01]